MPSPLLINADPGWIDEYSGWEYDTDDFYDDLLPPLTDAPDPLSERAMLDQRKRPEADALAANNDGLGKRKRQSSPPYIRRKKRRRALSSENQEGFSDADTEEPDTQVKHRAFVRPLVVWREESNDKRSGIPLVRADEGVRVALLKDWRERLEGGFSLLEVRKEANRTSVKATDSSAPEIRRGMKTHGKRYLHFEETVKGNEQSSEPAKNTSHETNEETRQKKRLKDVPLG